jgi:hypothetical protein
MISVLSVVIAGRGKVNLGDTENTERGRAEIFNLIRTLISGIIRRHATTIVFRS